MKPFFLLYIAIVCLGWAGKAQSVEQAFAGKTDCIEIDLIALDIIPKFYQSGQLDSIELTLDFVSATCIETASLRLARILMLIEQHRFSDTLITPLTLYYIKKESQALGKERLHDFEQFGMTSYSLQQVPGFNPLFGAKGLIEAAYVQMLHSWAMKLAMRAGNDPLEIAVINHLLPEESMLATDATLWKLAAGQPKNSSFAKAYDRYHAEYVLLRSWQFTFAAGTWQPFGDFRNVMGPRALLTFTVGKNFGNGKGRIDFGGSFPLGTMPAPFTVVRPDTSFTSNASYFSYIHLDYVHNIWRPNRFLEWNVNLGLSVAEKTVHEFASDGVGEDNPKEEAILERMGSRNSYGFGPNVGTEFKVFLGSGFAFNMQARYHLSSPNKIEGTSFRGSSLQVAGGFTVHIGGHPPRGKVSINSFW